MGIRKSDLPWVPEPPDRQEYVPKPVVFTKFMLMAMED